jgi:hypothetical protein
MYASHSREMGADPGPPKAKAGFRKIKDITKDVKPAFTRSRSTESPTVRPGLALTCEADLAKLTLSVALFNSVSSL